jgi:dUTP pyrophosphatase
MALWVRQRNVDTVPVPVSIHRLDPSIPLPAYQTTGAAGFDLASSADMVVESGEVALVPTGLVIEVPKGHVLGVFARSSTPLKRGLMVANGVGVVDSDYCGPADEIKIEVFNFTAAPVAVKRGDRLAQGLLIPVVRAEWEEREPVAPSRGGFGATG